MMFRDDFFGGFAPYPPPEPFLKKRFWTPKNFEKH
jgi:hypothetical protein